MLSRFSPFRLLTPFMILLLICAASYWLNPEPWHHLTLTTKALFAGSVLVVVGLLIGLRNRMYLRIDEQGLEIQYIAGAPRTYPWSDIESASIFKIRFLMIPMVSSIHLRLAPGVRSANPVRKIAGKMTGANASFPAMFDESAEEIVEKINFYKRRI